MNPTSGLVSSKPGNGATDFATSNSHDLYGGYSELQLLHGTPEFEPLRRMFLDFDPAISEDELILQLRVEAARLLPCDKVCIALPSGVMMQVFERYDGNQSLF